MKSIAELRKKYWSGNITKLVPATVSPSHLETRFDFSELKFDRDDLAVAQGVASKAAAMDKSHGDMREKLFSKANYHLAGAYQVAGKNEEFWSQF